MPGAEPKKIVGRNIRHHRQELEWTQEVAAAQCGLHPIEFARAERGERDMRISTVAKIARGLEVSASELLEDV